MSGAEVAGWIAVAVGIAAIVVTIVIAVWQRSRKVLTFEAYTEFPLLAGNTFAGELEVRAGDQVLHMPHILIIVVRNAGNRSIRPEDFYEPLAVGFDDASLVKLAVDAQDVKGVEPRATSARSFEVGKHLLNRGEGFVCFGLLDGCPHNVRLIARVADTKVVDASRRSVSDMMLNHLSISIRLPGMAITLKPKSSSRRVPATRTVAPK